MSNAPSTLDDRMTRIADDHALDLQSTADSSLRTLATPVQFAGFWSAVALPLLYVPVLSGFAGGQPTFAVLLAVHAVALVCGYGYRRD